MLYQINTFFSISRSNHNHIFILCGCVTTEVIQFSVYIATVSCLVMGEAVLIWADLRVGWPFGSFSDISLRSGIACLTSSLGSGFAPVYE